MSYARITAMVYGGCAVLAPLLGLALGGLVAAALTSLFVLVVGIPAFLRWRYISRPSEQPEPGTPYYDWITADKITTGAITAEKITAARCEFDRLIREDLRP